MPPVLSLDGHPIAVLTPGGRPGSGTYDERDVAQSGAFTGATRTAPATESTARRAGTEGDGIPMALALLEGAIDRVYAAGLRLKVTCEEVADTSATQRIDEALRELDEIVRQIGTAVFSHDRQGAVGVGG